MARMIYYYVANYCTFNIFLTTYERNVTIENMHKQSEMNYAPFNMFVFSQILVNG